MKLFLLLIIPFLSFTQNNNTEYYKNGNLKYERTNSETGSVIKEYYKNGQLKKLQNEPEKTIETYYKNGARSYLRNNKLNTLTEEFYDRNGSLTIQIINNIITFNIYENAAESTDHNDHEHNHKHGHKHNHHH